VFWEPARVIDTSLDRPSHLGDDVWTSVQTHRARLDTALGATPSDRGAAIGAAKDLVECIARAVCEERGEPSPGDKYPQHVTNAHKALGRQTGEHLDRTSAMGALAQSLRGGAKALAEVRNEYGSGHGRPLLSDVEDEVLEMAVGTAMLWSRWALRRLGHLQHGNLDALITDLGGGGVFYRGTLPGRLAAANLADQPEDDQRRLGVAVARRAKEGTFMVAIDGIDAALARPSDAFPEHYRRGLLTGLLTASDGTTSLTAQAARYLPRVAETLPDHEEALTRALAATDGARLNGYLAANEHERRQALQQMRQDQAMIPAPAQAHWARLMILLNPDATGTESET